MSDTTNPYSPPQVPQTPSDEHKGVVFDVNGRFVQAGLLARLGGAIVDGLFGFAVLLSVGALFGLLQHGELMNVGTLLSRSPGLSPVLYIVSPLVTIACQGMLIHRRGQSVGKIILRTRIVLGDGKVAGVHHGFVLRTLPIVTLQVLMTAFGATQLNSLLGFALIIDALFIFGSSRQCAHDRWAGTFVAKAR